MKYIRAMWVLLAAFLISTGSIAFAAPTDLQQPTSTPTPTPTYPGLPSPPFNGGVVANIEFQVYDGPGREFAVLGGLPYGAFVYPDVRTDDGQWVRIDYGGVEGWIRTVPILWGINYTALPVLDVDLAATPGPSPTALTLTPGQDNLTEATPTLPEAAIDATATPTPAASATQEQVATPEPASTEIAEVASGAQPTTQPTDDDDIQEPPPRRANIGATQIGIGLAAVIGVLFSVRYLLSLRRSDRYWRDGFVVKQCLVCKTGDLILEDQGRGRHVVRCDNCRSVLRHAGGNRWRYAVDPGPDAEFSGQYNSKVLTEDELQDLGDERLG